MWHQYIPINLSSLSICARAQQVQQNAIHISWQISPLMPCWVLILTLKAAMDSGNKQKARQHPHLSSVFRDILQIIQQGQQQLQQQDVWSMQHSFQFELQSLPSSLTTTCVVISGCFVVVVKTTCCWSADMLENVLCGENLNYIYGKLLWSKASRTLWTVVF